MYDYTHIDSYEYIYTGQKQSYEETLAVTYNPYPYTNIARIPVCLNILKDKIYIIMHIDININ